MHFMHFEHITILSLSTMADNDDKDAVDSEMAFKLYCLEFLWYQKQLKQLMILD